MPASVIPSKTKQITIRLDPRIYSELVDICELIGVKPAQLAGLAVGDHVARMKASYGAVSKGQELVIQELGSVITTQFSNLVNSDRFIEIMGLLPASPKAKAKEGKKIGLGLSD